MPRPRGQRPTRGLTDRARRCRIGDGDRDAQSLERSVVSFLMREGGRAGVQASADQHEGGRGPRCCGDGQDRVEVRAIVDGQAVEVIRRASIDGIVDLDHVAPRGGQCDVEEWVNAEDVATFGKLGSLWREDPDRRVQPAVDPLGLEVEEQSLPFSPLEHQKVNVGYAIQLAALDRVHLARARFLGRVVRLDLDRFRTVADDEGSWIADAIGPDRRRSW